MLARFGLWRWRDNPELACSVDVCSIEFYVSKTIPNGNGKNALCLLTPMVEEEQREKDLIKLT